MSALDDKLRFGTEICRTPEAKICHLTNLHATQNITKSMRNTRINGILGDVTLDTLIVHETERTIHPHSKLPRLILLQLTTLHLHLMRRLPRTRNHLTHATHRLRIARNNGDRPHIVQNILGSNRLPTNARLRKGHILLKRLIQMMTHHEHIQMLIDGIGSIRPRRIGTARDHIHRTTHPNDIRRMSTSRTLTVVGMNRSILHGCQTSLTARAFVERIGMNRHLNIVLLRHAQTIVNGRRRGAPILVQFEPTCTRFNGIDQALRFGRVAFPRKPKVQRQTIGSLHHHAQMRGRWGTRRGTRPGSRAGPTPEHRRQSRRNGLIGQLRTDIVNVRINSPRSEYGPFTSNDFGVDANDQIRRHPILRVGISSLANSNDGAIVHTNVGLVDAGIIDNERIGNDQIERLL
mmetsp:Transcript_24303/g.37461  ORF Transcript_24303/g.37461 Transcript_24303/m.37461 type:complete len:405 (+) Transcript_24303:486-1700(+)